MITTEQLLGVIEEMNKTGLVLSIETRGVMRDDLEEAFLNAVEEADDAGKASEIPLNVVEVYNRVVEELQGSGGEPEAEEKVEVEVQKEEKVEEKVEAQKEESVPVVTKASVKKVKEAGKKEKKLTGYTRVQAVIDVLKNKHRLTPDTAKEADEIYSKKNNKNLNEKEAKYAFRKVGEVLKAYGIMDEEGNLV